MNRLILVTVILSAAVFASPSMSTPESRPLVSGGIYDKPFITNVRGGVRIGGYVDAQFRYEREEGVLDEATFGLERINLFTYTPVSDRVRVAAELEFEEGGEEIKIELAIIDFEIHHALTFRGGIILSPLGRFNLAHDSPANELTDRPLVSTQIIPATLSEPGMGFYGAFYPSSGSRVTYEAYATNGFHAGIIEDSPDGTRFTAGKGNWEDNNARPSFVSRIGVSPMPMAEFGISIHTGPYNEFEVEGLEVDAKRNATLFALDTEIDWRYFRLTGEYARGDIDVPVESAVFQENQQGFYAELSGKFAAGLFSALPGSYFSGVGRFDFVDFDSDTDGDSHRRLTVGINFRPAGDTVFKLDWQRNWSRDAFNIEGNSAAVLFSTASYF